MLFIKMEDNFDVDKFISLVKAKESIWNYKSKTYGNKVQRRDDWKAICADMVEDFGEKTNAQKNAIAVEYQAKWKVLRDGFTRSVKNYKKKGDIYGSKGKLYTYYTQLQFLNNLYSDTIVIPNEAACSMHAKDQKGRKRAGKNGSESSSSEELDDENMSKTKKAKHGSSNDSEFDEDKQFFLSLLSDFKKITEDQKLDAKGDIINVIRHYRNTPISQYQTRGSYYSNDIAALATTATEPPHTPTSSFYEHNGEVSRENSPTEIKFINT